MGVISHRRKHFREAQAIWDLFDTNKLTASFDDRKLTRVGGPDRFYSGLTDLPLDGFNRQIDIECTGGFTMIGYGETPLPVSGAFYGQATNTGGVLYSFDGKFYEGGSSTDIGLSSFQVNGTVTMFFRSEGEVYFALNDVLGGASDPVNRIDPAITGVSGMNLATSIHGVGGTVKILTPLEMTSTPRDGFIQGALIY